LKANPGELAGALLDVHDVQLVEELAGGNPSALGRLYDRHAPLLLGVGMRIFKNRSEAEDVLHDVFMEVWRRADTFDAQRGSVRAWLVVRMKSRCLDKIRSAGRSRAVSLSSPQGEKVLERKAGAPGAVPKLRSEENALKDAVNNLSEDLKATVEAVYFQGMALKDAAEALKVPVGTVKSRLSAARKRMRSALEEGGIP
jgi:RNA polymerase sigma-70 factor (ECF subfamily)